MLGYGTVPNPPTYVVASKIIVDLQLPSKSTIQFKEMYFYSSNWFIILDELEIYVRTMDKIINKGADGFDDKSWRHVKFSDKVPSENVYAGALVMFKNWSKETIYLKFLLFFVGPCFDEINIWIGRGYRI